MNYAGNLSSHGDFHNFQRRVQTRISEKGIILEKPRPVFWEWFFFGYDSPLREAFKKTSLYESFFGLQILSSEKHHGIVSHYQVSPASLPPKPKLVSQYGDLLAYTFLFGIEDIHKENVIIGDDRLQVVDAEVVLSELDLPNQSLLLPFKAIAWEQTAMSCLGSRDYFSVPDLASCLIEGFFNTASTIIDSKPAILKVAGQYQEQIATTPIRILLRPTREYTGHLPPTSEFINEELTQSKRGDVPYFFTFAGSNSIYYYSTEDYQYTEVQPSELTQLHARSLPRSLDQLLDDEKLFLRLVNGLCYLANEFMPKKEMGQVHVGSLAISYTPETIKIESPDFELEAERI